MRISILSILCCLLLACVDDESPREQGGCVFHSECVGLCVEGSCVAVEEENRTPDEGLSGIDLDNDGVSANQDCDDNNPDLRRPREGCPPGSPCVNEADCESDVCAVDQSGNRICQAASCQDGVKNGSEVDVDCAGNCPLCQPNQRCNIPSDCESGVCTGSRCQEARCWDDVRNGGESDVDCGGPCDMRCSAGLACNMGDDCQSSVCSAIEGLVCVPPSCSDNILNGEETDVDCGGSCDEKCYVGDNCRSNLDCRTNRCLSGSCGEPCPVGYVGANCDGCDTTNNYRPTEFGTCIPAGSGQVGAECFSLSDCSAETSCFFLPGGEATGICSTTCSTFSENCPGGAVCTETAIGNLCLLECSSNINCQASGEICLTNRRNDPSWGTDDAAMPSICYDSCVNKRPSWCAENFSGNRECDEFTGQCECVDPRLGGSSCDLILPGTEGCQTSSDCAAGASCYRPQTRRDFGLPGLCNLEDCTSDQDCGGGARCSNWGTRNGEPAIRCLEECGVDADCSGQQVCYLTNNVCMPHCSYGGVSCEYENASGVTGFCDANTGRCSWDNNSSGNCTEVTSQVASQLNYGPNQNRDWNLSPNTSSSVTRIRLYFSQFNVEENYDYVRIYRRYGSTATPLESFTGSRGPFWTSYYETNALRINFTSDDIEQRSGFTISKYEYCR